jgi:hypothetical protein
MATLLDSTAHEMGISPGERTNLGILRLDRMLDRLRRRACNIPQL